MNMSLIKTKTKKSSETAALWEKEPSVDLELLGDLKAPSSCWILEDEHVLS